MKGLEPLRLAAHDPKLIKDTSHPCNSVHGYSKTGKLYQYPHLKDVKLYQITHSYNVYILSFKILHQGCNTTARRAKGQ